MYVQINKPGHNIRTAAIELAFPVSRDIVGNRGDHTVSECHIRNAVNPVLRIYYMAVSKYHSNLRQSMFSNAISPGRNCPTIKSVPFVNRIMEQASSVSLLTPRA